MKTSAIVAQLFEPTTAQTAKNSSASAGSAADFSKMVASARGQGMFFSPQDASQLVPMPAERPVTLESRQAPSPRADQQQAKPQAAAPSPAKSADKPQQARDTQSAPAARDVAERQSSTDDAAAKPVADDDTSSVDDQTATDSTAVVPVVVDTAPPETLPASVPALALLSNIASAEGTDTAGEDPSGADGSAVEAILAASSSQTQGAGAASGNTATNAPQQTQRQNQNQNQNQQQTALDAAQAANPQTASAESSAVPQDAGSVLKAAAAAADDKGASAFAPQQGQAADLASLAAGAGLTVKSGNDRPSSLPQSSLVSGAMMAQSVDGEAAAAAAANAGNSQNGDAAFLAKGEAQATFANAMNSLGQAPAAQGARPFAAAMEAVAGPSTTAATSSAPAAAPPIAGIGATNATLASGATGIAQTATPARGPQMAAPLQQLSGAMANAALKGQDSISIQLSPGDLGKVDVKLDFSGDHVTAAISAEKPETLDLLQKDSRALEKMLGDAGLQTNQQSLSFSLQGQQNQNTQTSAREERSSRSRAQLLSIDDAAPTTAIQSRARTTVGGIDISV